MIKLILFILYEVISWTWYISKYGLPKPDPYPFMIIENF